MRLGNERGMVLLAVLMLVAILSALVIDRSYSTLIDLRLTETYRDSTRAYYLARGGIEVGRRLLATDSNGYDAADEMWAAGVEHYPVSEEASVSIHIEDLDGRLDVNRLVTSLGNVDVTQRDRFRRLFDLLGIDRPEERIDALIDWIDPDDTPEAAGAETPYYLSRPTPYRCKNGPLDDLDELRRIKGFDATTVALLRPHLTIAGSATINLNTADLEVLQALSDDMTQTIAQAVIDQRQRQPFHKVEEVRDIAGMEPIYSSIHSQLSVSSNYYHIRATGEVNDGRSRISAIVSKKPQRVLSQRLD